MRIKQPISVKEVIFQLEKYNKWRKGDDTIEQPSPVMISFAIDEAIIILKSLDRTATNKDI